MNEFDEKRDKTKAFKASQKSLNAINEIIKKSGKNDIEFFEELVNDLLIKGLTDDGNEAISADLRRHFESDVQKLKNATNSIQSIFVSQMENISVEKNQWQAVTTKQLDEKQEALDKQVSQYSELKQEFDASKLEVTEFIKENESLQKEREVLVKRTEDQEQLIQDRSERINDLGERINKLNETIVAKDGQLKEFSTMTDQNKTLEEQNNVLLLDIQRLTDNHQEALEKKEEQLIFECEKAKHKVETSLLATFQVEKETVRNETRKETELAIREFYLGEIQRRDIESAAKEEAYKIQIEALQAQIKKERES